MSTLDSTDSSQKYQCITIINNYYNCCCGDNKFSQNVKYSQCFLCSLLNEGDSFISSYFNNARGINMVEQRVVADSKNINITSNEKMELKQEANPEPVEPKNVKQFKKFFPDANASVFTPKSTVKPLQPFDFTTNVPRKSKVFTRFNSSKYLENTNNNSEIIVNSNQEL